MKNRRNVFHSPIGKPCDDDNGCALPSQAFQAKKLRNGMTSKSSIGGKALAAGKGAESPLKVGRRGGRGQQQVESNRSLKGRKKARK